VANDSLKNCIGFIRQSSVQIVVNVFADYRSQESTTVRSHRGDNSLLLNNTTDQIVWRVVSRYLIKTDPSFSGITDVIGSNQVRNVRATLMKENPNALILELVTGRDQGLAPVEITVPGGMGCPAGTHLK